MREEKWFDILKSYLWRYRGTAILLFSFCGIFFLVFSLYELELEAVVYAAGLCLVFLFFVCTVDFFLYRRRHLELKKIQKNISLIEEFPIPKDLLEADYQNMIEELRVRCDEISTEWEKERKESIEYYTTWVHQIKTPIAVMDLILQSEDTEEYRELKAELFQIEQYVEMVLAYLRLGEETSDFVFEEQDLDQMIKQVIHKYASQFVRKRIGLSYEPTQRKVLSDEKWLSFILEQILSNAIKYTKKGRIEISVTKENVLKISDTGIGIAEEDLPRIFEKGFTGYNGRADKKATGLGLYLCHLAAEKLRNKISVESTVGEGTTVFLDLHREALEVE